MPSIPPHITPTLTDKKSGPILVSACLLGLKTRYDGTAAPSEQAKQATEGSSIVPICPEQLSGLPTPRPRAEIVGGDGDDVLDGKATVVDEFGTDVTELFLRGASEVLKVARLTGSTEILLKEKSPSCGVESICSRSEAVPGRGVTTAFLKREGLTVRGF